MDIKKLAKSDVAKEFLKLIDEVKSKVADIRYKPEMSIDIRKGVIEALETELVEPLRRHRGEEVDAEKKKGDNGNDDWN